MHLTAVCTGKARPFANKTGQTGIDKKPVTGQVQIGLLGLRGDEVADTKNHGGADQAVYIYTQPDYDFWTEALGRALEPGAFGENLVFSGLESAGVAIGQQFQVGTVVLEVTAARIPCGTFAAHMGDPQFVKKFRDARRPGLYARVMQPGTVQVGDEVRSLGTPAANAPTILDTYEFAFDRSLSLEQITRLLAAPVAARLRADLLQMQAQKQAALALQLT